MVMLTVDFPAAPSGIKSSYDHFTKTEASVNVTWSTSRGADNYTVRVTPTVKPGQTSYFTTTDTSLQLMLMYNVNYSINITAHLSNCIGSNSTVVPLIVGEIMAWHDYSSYVINSSLSKQLVVVLPFLP